MFSIEEFAEANEIPLEEISPTRFEWLLKEADSTSFESGSTSGGVWLSKQDRILLRGRGGGAYSVNMMPADVGERSAYYRHCDAIWHEL